jgi:hypothetical protein
LKTWYWSLLLLLLLLLLALRVPSFNRGGVFRQSVPGPTSSCANILRGGVVVRKSFYQRALQNIVS